MMMDFVQNESRDPYQYIDYADSMLAFTTLVDEEISVEHDHLKLLGYLSNSFVMESV